MDGEFFRGGYCPRDGSSTKASIEVAGLVAAMRDEDVVPSLEELADRGFGGPWNDVVVAQFRSREDACSTLRSLSWGTKVASATMSKRAASSWHCARRQIPPTSPTPSAYCPKSGSAARRPTGSRCTW